MDKTDIINEIIVAEKDGVFFDKIKEIYINEIPHKEKKLTICLIELHNNGIISLNKLYKSIPTEKTKDSIYILFNIYSLSIPQLSCSVTEVFDTLREIKEKGLEFIDLHEGIYNFLRKKNNHPIEAMKLSQADDCFTPFISSIIIAANQHNPSWCIEQINKYVKSENILLRAQAYNAIRRISLKQEEHIDFILEIISTHSIIECESLPKINLLNGLISFGKNHHDRWDKLTTDLKNLLKFTDRDIIHQVSLLAHIEYNKIPFSLTSALIDLLKNTEWNTEVKSSIELLLIDLAKDNKEVIAIELIESKYKDQFALSQLQSLWHYIKKENNALINKIITKWLLNGKPELCNQLGKTLNQDDDNQIQLIIDEDIIKSISDDEILFIARKSVGWLFTNPLHLFSFLFSIHDKSPKKLKPSILTLMFNPVLISYPGELGEYINSLEERKDINIVFLKLRNMLNEYFWGLENANKIREIKTSDKNRELQWDNSNKLIEKASKEGPKSIFHDMFHVNHLLHGNSSLHYFYNKPNEDHQLNETKMHTFSHSSEIPNLNIIDPFGLNRSLLTFRMEDKK